MRCHMSIFSRKSVHFKLDKCPDIIPNLCIFDMVTSPGRTKLTQVLFDYGLVRFQLPGLGKLTKGDVKRRPPLPPPRRSGD